VVAVLALVVMIGANNLSGAEKAYFGAMGPGLAPSAPTYTPIGSPTVVTVAPATGTYRGSVSLTATLTSGGTGVSGKTLSFTLNGTAVCGGTSGVTCPTTSAGGTAVLSGVSLGTIDAGTYTTGILVSFQGDANYSLSTGTGTLTISQASQAIAFAQPASPAPYLSTFTVAPTATSGLPPAIVASGGCTAVQSGSSFTITMTSSATTCVLTATQSGNVDYSAATPVTVSVAAGKASATITISNTAQTYNGSPRPVTVTTSPTGLAYTVTYSGSPTAPTNAGSYTVNATVNDPDYQGTASGTLVISKAPATLTFTGPLTVTYNGTQQLVTVATSPAGLSTSAVTYNGGTTPPTNAGSYAISATVTDPNYQGSASGTLTIAPATSNVLVDAKTVSSSKNTQISLTASVYASGATPVPAVNQGTLTFSFTGANPCSSISPASVNVASAGAASSVCTIKNGVNPGTFTVKATYNPDGLGNFGTSNSSALMTTVSNGAKNTNLTVSPAVGSVAGGPVTLQATLTNIAGGGVSGKSISLSLDGTAMCGGGTGVTCPTTNASGVASLTVNTGPTGSNTYPITGTWAGDGSNLASTGSAKLTVD
jgi:hypothetical protein